MNQEALTEVHHHAVFLDDARVELMVNSPQASPNHLDERTFIRALPQQNDTGHGLIVPPLRQNHAVGDDLRLPGCHGIQDSRTLLH